ncbi:hypothetical protein NUW54_g14288 [Trametes sanguinea]|uniref:Uncharacterized protein n=1 Tax=Trametes sanguinea TaxID=158606 RepID=A0ACC1MFD4_9APHY|nr:hypothetical protein NUW54_g14288 [Trametes sanguinea]
MITYLSTERRASSTAAFLRLKCCPLHWRGLAEITENSPDAIQSTKRALLLAGRHGSVEEAVIAHVTSKESKRAFTSENIQEGLKAFTEKRKPAWKNPAKL